MPQKYPHNEADAAGDHRSHGARLRSGIDCRRPGLSAGQRCRCACLAASDTGERGYTAIVVLHQPDRVDRSRLNRVGRVRMGAHYCAGRKGDEAHHLEGWRTATAVIGRSIDGNHSRARPGVQTATSGMSAVTL